MKEIDCTPTWLSLIPVLLQLYVENKEKPNNEKTMEQLANLTTTWLSLIPVLLQLYVENKEKPNNEKTREQLANLTIEFKRMAAAADNWNAYVREQLAKNGH